MRKYIPSDIEPKWQKKWQEDKLYKVDLDKPKKKFYLLVEFTYPSGDLHIGHWFAFAVPDVLGRFKRMQGYNVFSPNGFDAFGLPAENAAIQRGVHPRDWTINNIENMKRQFSLMGAIHDWENTVTTCMPDYYKWNQWIFLKMLEKGIAYKGRALANWCPSCQTVLANENVEAGKCWRCGSEVIQKEVEQWFLKITEYAERLLWPASRGEPDNPSVDWPKPIREGQNNWIGKSEGVVISFDDLKVFTTRPDTLFGATFMVISPEHPLLNQYVKPEEKRRVEDYLSRVKLKSELERKEQKEKSGVFTGSYAKNPMSGEKIPVWIADYVLMGYGTGAIMAVPAHDQRDFEFAKKYELKIKQVIDGSGKWQVGSGKAYEGEGVLINSGEFNGLDSEVAKKKISDYLELHHLAERQINYHLRDWSISRQRYWGTPIPIINCPKCGIVPVSKKDLPVELPYEVDYAPKGKPPLATAQNWVNVKCPNCGGEAKREAETMDTFVDSSWYFLRYLDHQNDSEIASKKRLKDWMLVDIYFGGAEHTLGHTLYSRFFYKFLIDIGVINFESFDPSTSSGLRAGEYAQKRLHHGVILGADGYRMSKSRGNVVNPDQQVKEYGADTVRLYLCFIGPYDIVAPWNPSGINGVYRFLQRVWGLMDKVSQEKSERDPLDLRMMHKTIKKVTEDVEAIKFNTAVAALMEWLNHLSKRERVSKDEYKTLLLLLAPFAPHITEELWSGEAGLGEKYSIHNQPWPKFDDKYLKEDEVTIVVQINGKMRDTVMIEKDMLNNKEAVEKIAKSSQKVTKYLQGFTVKKTVYVRGRVINFIV